MNFKFLLKGFAFSLLSTLVIAKDECEEVRNYLIGKRPVFIDKCKMDDKGNLINLQVEYDSADNTELDYILHNYKNITTFEYTYKAGVDYDEEDIFGYYPGEPEYPRSIAKLENLKNLKIKYHFFRNTSERLHLPKNIKNLSLYNVGLTEENVQEIATLKELKTLTVDNNFIHKEYNYTDFQSLQKLKALTVYNKGDIVDMIKVKNEFLKNFKNIEVFQYSLVRLTKSNINNVLEELPNLKEFRIIDCECNRGVTTKYIRRRLGDNIKLVKKNTKC